MINRRRFLNTLLGGGALGSLAVMFFPVLRYLLPPEETEAEPGTLKLGPVKDFPPGASKIFRFGRKPAILVRDLGGNFHCLSATCTHLDCIVQYRKDQDAIWCACHNGRYDLSGNNISGPPPRPLDLYEVKIIEGEVVVTKSA